MPFENYLKKNFKKKITFKGQLIIRFKDSLQNRDNFRLAFRNVMNPLTHAFQPRL